MTTRIEPPETGGVIIKQGANTKKPKVREFYFQLDPTSNRTHIVYRTQNIFAKESENRVVLSTFFVRKVRNACDEELTLVRSSGHKVGRRCFDVDFYDPNFPLAVGPQKLRTVSVFPIPENSLGDLWTYFAQEMFAENIFQPDSLDPDQPVVVGVGTTNSPQADSICIPPKPLSPDGRTKSASFDALIDSLPLPPPDTEVIEIDDDSCEDSVIAGN
jgi:hypothetical protein